MVVNSSANQRKATPRQNISPGPEANKPKWTKNNQACSCQRPRIPDGLMTLLTDRIGAHGPGMRVRSLPDAGTLAVTLAPTGDLTEHHDLEVTLLRHEFYCLTDMALI